MTTEPTQVPSAELIEPISTADRDELQELVTEVERGFSTNDADLMNRRLTEDALVVNALGSALRGRAQIEEITRSALTTTTLRSASAHYRLSDIALLARDVAVAHKSAWSNREAAEAGDAPEMNALYVFVRRNGRWWIARRQNTLVPSSSE